jgi:predicted transcriptional regulator
MEAMTIEARKINLINWISTIQEDNILEQVEKIQKEKTDWWDTISDKDKKAINEGLEQLDRGEYLTHSQVRSKIKERFKF